MGKKDIGKILNILNRKYKVKIEKVRPFEILIHGILSTRTKDETTFGAQDRLLKIAKNPEQLSKLNVNTIKKTIYPVSFYKTKANLLRKAAEMLLLDFNGRVPRAKEDLLKIPGVGPKVASLVEVWGFGIPSIPVDTHVNRISQRLGIVPKNNKPENTQVVLESLLNIKQRMLANHILVTFGQDLCRPTAPQCYRCPIYSYCKFEKKKYYKNRVNTINKSYKQHRS